MTLQQAGFDACCADELLQAAIATGSKRDRAQYLDQALALLETAARHIRTAKEENQ